MGSTNSRPDESVRESGKSSNVPLRRLSRGSPLVGEALDKSIWRERKFGPKYQSDSYNFVDTERCAKKAFLSDWSHTSGGAVLAADMTGRAFGSTKLTRHILEAIMDVLFEHYPMLLRVFTYYSCIGSEVTGAIFGIGKAGYTLLLNDSRLDLNDSDSYVVGSSDQDVRRIPRHAKRRGEDGFDLLWTAVNASAISQAQGKTNAKERLVRSEFLEWVVRAATDEQPPERMVQNVQIFCQDLSYFLGIHDMALLIFSNANWFRLDACYVIEVDSILRKHAYTLRSIFEVYAAAKGAGNDTAERDDLMNYDEWALLWQELGFTRELTDRKVGSSFAQSRMLVINEHSRSGKSVQLERLPFEGFLEAFLRIADIKALPSAEELEAHGHVYPGDYVMSIRSKGVQVYQGWAIEANRLQDEGMADPLWERLDCLVMIIVHAMQNGVEASKGSCATGVTRRHTTDVKLSMREVKTYRSAPQPNLLGSTEMADAGHPNLSMGRIGRDRTSQKLHGSKQG